MFVLGTEGDVRTKFLPARIEKVALKGKESEKTLKDIYRFNR